MGRFNDGWVIDKSLYEFLNLGDGACACCDVSDIFNPDGLKGLINSISDLETDDADAEMKAAQQSPWPPHMRDQVWGDRVRLQFKMKKDMSYFRDFFDYHEVDTLDLWCREKLGPHGLQKIFQMPRSEIMDDIRAKYNVMRHGGFGVVLTSVIEQVANFKKTKLPTDGIAAKEIDFEKILTFDRRSGFTIPITTMNSANNLIISDDVFRVFLDMMVSLGGQKLLARRPKKTSNTDKNEVEDVDDVNDDLVQDGSEQYQLESNKRSGPSFRHDRRAVRLLIARYWACQLITRFNADTK